MRVPGLLTPTLEWIGGVDGHVAMIDQTLLPARLKVVRVRDVQTMWRAIRRLAVRGAPAIGIAAAYGFVLGLRRRRARGPEAWRAEMGRVVRTLASARPTAVNLFWALERMRAKGEELLAAAGARPGWRARVLEALLREARAIHEEDRALCDAIGRQGARLLRGGGSVLTHCNAGALATGGSGTALAVIYAALRDGKRIRVFADETRPLLQGSRLTAWELGRAGIDVTVICDSAAAAVLRAGAVQCAIVGADRIAGNGDVANKIGTYGLAVLARAHGVPFYVAAPSTTFDRSLRSGREIPIEERSPNEVLEAARTSRRAGRVKAFNPAFDVTPARLVTAIITERGVIRAPYARNIARVLGDTRKRGRRAAPRPHSPSRQ
jgi:methylthioribose-1-phosphate isomerase